ncbi:MFS general substrate transporter [Apiospora kogelbergensis]|uniref:MFS general substrate transporter n=1 Tax=Apiospora kogelbergensis TaxID=1337665 RepID=A0AAW0QY52_9PEZI
MTVELDISFAELNGGSVRNIAGLAIGCILFIPSTMKYGRRPTYIISATIIAAASWWSARVQTLADMYVTNFIYGLESSPNETIAQLTIADPFSIHHRDKANSLYVIASTLWNTLSPTLAVLQAQAQGWRWSYCTMVIVLSLLVVVFIFFLEETSYTPFP